MKRVLKKNKKENIDEEMLRLWRNVLSKSWRGVPFVVRENLVDSLLFPYFLVIVLRNARKFQTF